MPPKKQKIQRYKPSKNWLWIESDEQGNETIQFETETRKKKSSEAVKNKHQDSTLTQKKRPDSIINKSSNEQQQRQPMERKTSSILKGQPLNKKNSQSTSSTLTSLRSTVSQQRPSARQQRPNPARSSTVESRWNRQSQIGTRSAIKRQYERYFGDVKNVFHQDTALMKEAEWISSYWKIILFLFIINFLIWLTFWSISPYQKKCPRHATCGAYVHCHEGYILNERLEICQVDPQVTETALAIMNSVIEDMKLQWGQKQCSIPPNITASQLTQHLSPPKRSFSEVFKQLDIQSPDFQLLRTILVNHFNDNAKQVIGKFKKDEFSRLQPLEKMYTLTCKMDLFYRHNFKLTIFIIFIMFIAFILSLVYLSHQLYKRKGRKIYQFLKERTLQKKEIHFDQYKDDIQKRFNNNKQIPEHLWVLINQYRIKQKIIGSYQLSEGLSQGIIWRSLASV